MSDNVSTREVQSPIVFNVPETEVNQCVTQKGQDENKQMQCSAQADTVYKTKNVKK